MPTKLEEKTPCMNTKNSNPVDEVMCNCSDTTLDNIQSLFGQGLDMEAISRRTGALSGCGGREWDIAAFLNDLAVHQKIGS